jgi:uncharacterized DUF497 family protein
MSDALLFEWDEAKSPRNRTERGFNFEYACRIFAGPVIEEEDGGVTMASNGSPPREKSARKHSS